MFDIGFQEVALIALIALVVVGPDRLPGMARNVGLWVGRIRRYVSHVKEDIEREIRADELRELINTSEDLNPLREVAEQTQSIFDEAKETIESADRELDATNPPVTEPTPSIEQNGPFSKASLDQQVTSDDSSTDSSSPDVPSADASSADAAPEGEKTGASKGS